MWQISHDINMIQQYRKYILQTYLKFQWAYDVNSKYTHTSLYHVAAACHHNRVSILWRLHISCLSLSDWMLQVSFSIRRCHQYYVRVDSYMKVIVICTLMHIAYIHKTTFKATMSICHIYISYIRTWHNTIIH